MPRRDKTDRINLDDWVQRPDSKESSVDADATNTLKQKMREKEDKERQKVSSPKCR